jgi:hypothetical protein
MDIGIKMSQNLTDITPEDSAVPVFLMETDEQELENRRAEYQAQQEVIELAKTERATKLASAITKLKALGLTETEAKIIIGIE